MSKVLQVFYFLCYGLAALAIAFMAPKIFPETPRGVAWLAAAVVFLSGALMHEIASRCYQASLDRHRLAVLHRAYVEAMEDIDRLAVDVRALRRAASFDALEEEPAFPAPSARAAPESPPLPLEPAADTIGFDLPDEGAQPPEMAEPEIAPSEGTTEAKLLRSLVGRLFASSGSNGNTATVSGSLVERETLNTVREALRLNLLDLYVQPVVKLPQRKPLHQDCEMRISSGSGDFMPPAMYNEIIRANGLMLPVDDILLFRTVQRIELGPVPEPGAYTFCKILPDSLSDREFFAMFLDYLRKSEDLVSRIAFEFREANVIDLDDAGAGALGSLVDLGFNLCVSELHNFDVETEHLVEGGVRFVKVDAEMFMPAIGNDAETARLRRFKRGLDDVGIELVVTGIANEQLLVELLDFEIGFGQGPLFGDPRKTGQAQMAATEGRRERM